MLDGDWQDQSVNVLLPTQSAVGGVNLVIARDKLPLGMDLAGYVAQQRQNFKQQLTGLEILGDSPGKVDERDAHFLEISWRSDAGPLHQLMVTVMHERGAMLSFTGSLPVNADAGVRQALIAAITSFKFGA